VRRVWIVFVALAVPAIWVPAVSRAQWTTPWSYEGPDGPDHWGDLDPAYVACKAGREQSPIDIRDAHATDLPAMRFDYHSGPLKYLINNGYTIRLNYHDAPGAGNVLTVGGKSYHLTQFHFHHPSEEYVGGKPYEMEVHLMHEAGDGAVMGVTVFLKAGSPNATVQRMWDHMPTTAGKEQEIPGVEVNPANLLPSDAAYDTYKGSLTAPPCTEGVTWFVLKTPVEISAAEISAFAKLYPHDVRPLQPLNGRLVQASR
jgi:carbonic anhydrase